LPKKALIRWGFQLRNKTYKKPMRIKPPTRPQTGEMNMGMMT